MRGPASRSCAAALLGALLATGVAGAEPLRDVIETCKSRLDPQIDVGYARIASRCPELVRLLESSEWRSWLPRSWREAGNDLSVRGLEELATLVERERTRQRAGRRPGTAALHEVLEGLGPTQPERAGRWSRLRGWFDTVFDRPADEDRSTWLARLLQRSELSETMLETISYLAVALVLALAGLIIVSEIRASGAFRRPRSVPERPVPLERRAVPRVTRSQIDAAPLAERPGLLLRLVLERLAQAGRLPRPASLTVREAQELAALPEPADRAQFAELSQAAEHARFADAPPACDALARALEAGAALLARLEQRGARAP